MSSWLRWGMVAMLGALACSTTGTDLSSGAKAGSDGGGNAPGAGGEQQAGGSSQGAGGSGTGNTGNTSSGGTGGGINVMGGGGNSNVGGGCAAIAQKADAKVLPADIIWVIDTSGSMSEETASVQQKMNAFAGGILSVGIDVRVVLLAEEYGCDDPFWNCTSIIPADGMCLPAPLGSGKCPADTNPPLYLHPNVEIASTDGLLRIIDSYPQWKQVLRPDSVKTIVMVTDDDATSPPYDHSSFSDGYKGAAKKFIDDFKALDPAILSNFKLSSIHCLSNCPQAANVGKTWDELVAQTGGVKGDLCKQDFQPVFNEIAKSVVAAAKLDCQWQIPPPPKNEKFDPGLVNVKFTSGAGAEQTIYAVKTKDDCDPQKGGWYYNNPGNPSAIIACPSTCTNIQADNMGKIDVLFGCATETIDLN